MKHGVQWVHDNIVAIPLILEISCGVSQLAAHSCVTKLLATPLL